MDVSGHRHLLKEGEHPESDHVLSQVVPSLEDETCGDRLDGCRTDVSHL